MVAAAVAQPPDDDVQKSAEERERAVVIVDLVGDGKTIQYTTSFTATWKDLDTGKVHVGTFTARRPSLGDLGKIAVIKAKLNGGEKVDEQIDFIHEMLAGLQVILIDNPDWWQPTTFFDARPLREVWDHVRGWIDNFRSKRVG